MRVTTLSMTGARGFADLARHEPEHKLLIQAWWTDEQGEDKDKQWRVNPELPAVGLRYVAAQLHECLEGTDAIQGEARDYYHAIASMMGRGVRKVTWARDGAG